MHDELLTVRSGKENSSERQRERLLGVLFFSANNVFKNRTQKSKIWDVRSLLKSQSLRVIRQETKPGYVLCGTQSQSLVFLSLLLSTNP